MKEMRRVLALVLCLVMLIGIVPAAAFATESEAPAEESGYTDLGTKTAAEGNEQQDPLPEEIQQLVGAPADAPALAADGETPIDAALFFSDLHTNANNYKDADIKRILGGLKNFGMKFSTVNSVGDAFSNNENKYTGYTSTITKSFQEAMGYSDFEMYYVWTDHDRGADIDNFTGLLYGDESTNYYLYTISMSDMSSSERYGQPSTFTESKLSDFTAAVEAMDHSKPLFILSHMPLHDRRNDNQYADEWYGVISAAAEKMDIAFFWGHNHTQEPVSEQAAYYVAKNGSETMMVEGMSKAVTPNFTYLCAGYMSPASTGYTASTTRQETVVAVTLYEDQVVYTLYDEDGAVSGDFALNEAVKRDHAAPKVEEPEVTEQTFYDDPDSPWASMTATAENGSVTDIYDDTNEDVNVLFQDGYWFGYDFALEGQVADTSVTIQMLLDPDAFDADNIAVYYFNGESYVAVTDYAVTADEGGLEYITISDAALGTYVYGTPNTDDVIPEGAVLKSLTVTPPDKTKYFDTDSQEREVDGQIMNIIALESDGMVVMANYTHGADKYTMELEWNQFGTLEEGYALSFEPLVAGQYGSQTVTVSYGGVSAAFTVWVCPEQLIIEGEETVVIDFDTASITGMVMGKVEDEAVLQTVAKTLEGLVTGALTVYDFTPTYANGDTALSGTAAITLPIPEGVTNPVVYYVSNNGDIERMPTTVNEDDTLTFTTTHFSTFVVTQDGLALEGKTEEVKGSSSTTVTVGDPVTIYRRVATPEVGKEYLIVAVNGNTRIGLGGNTSGYAIDAFNAGNNTYYTNWTGDPETSTPFVVGSDNYLGSTGSAYLWTVGEGYRFSHGGNVHLGYSYGLSFTTASNWTYSNNRLMTDVTTEDWFGNEETETYYLRVRSNNRSWSVSTNSSENNRIYTLYFYEPVTVTPVTTTTTGTPDHTYSVEVSAKSGSAMAGVAVDLTSQLKVTPSNAGSTSGWNVVYSVQGRDGEEGKGNPAVIKEIQGTKAILSGTAGTAVVRATYTKDGMEVYNEFSVTAVAPDHYGIQLHRASMTLASGVTESNFSSGTYYFYNKTTGFYERATAYEADTTYYTTPVIQGAQIKDGEPIALKDIDAGDVFAVWAVVKAYATADATQGTDLGALGDALTWAVSDPDIATIDTHTGVIHFTGEKFGTFTITVSYKGADGITISDTIEISATETIYVVPGDGTNDFPEYPAAGSVRFDKTATAVGNYSETGLAQVELSFTGVPYGSAADVVVVIDTSSSMKRDKDGNEQTSYLSANARYKIMVDSLQDMLEAFGAEVNGVRADIDLAIIDFNGYSTGSGLNTTTNFIPGSNVVDNSASDRTGTNYGTIYTGVATPTRITTSDNGGLGSIAGLGAEHFENTGAEAFDQDRINAIIAGFKGGHSGTNYDFAFDAAYELLKDKKAANEAAGKVRSQYVVFLTDGAPFRYNGFTADNQDGRNEMDRVLTGYYANATELQNAFTWMNDDVAAMYNPVDGTHPHRMAEAIKGIPGQTYYVVDSTNTQENGSYLKARDGLGAKIYSIGFCIADDVYSNQNDRVLEETSYEVIRTLSSGEGFYWEDVEDSDTLTGAFTDIVSSIRKATDVEVEDKVGNNYTISFGLPDNVTSEAADNMEEFYMQVVSYTLDEETHERTGAVEVLEKFTFDAETCAVTGHVVNGGADCGTGCTHVTYTGAVVTGINGTYFDYKSNAEGEFINWTADEISEKELALQYFAYLDKSAGYEGADKTPAGTYYTNEYATLTYDNVYGNRVQQKFPVPQMTWNGAQVTYTFYLVNEMGQPVNRAGLVVPFAEALYVTDTFTYSVKWHDLEQSAGLYAKYLAEQLVPDVYALYDDDASYMIHVYEDEKLVNLNNHFVISGDVTDDYSTGKGWTNPNTTYVFNTKADAEKYTASGTYVADDSTTNTGGSYLCQSAPIVGATFHEEVDNGVTVYVVDSLGEGYKQPIDKETQAPIDGETQVPVDQIVNAGGSTVGGTVIGGYVYYVGHDENGEAYVYTIVRKNDAAEVRPGFDFGNTTVAFAVVWKPSLAPDTVVVDYGLDVVVNVLQNDNMAVSAVGVRTDKPTVDGKEVVMNSGGYTGKQDKDAKVYIGDMQIGTAKVENLNSVRFSLDKDNGMKFTEPAVVYYEANVSYYETGKTEPTNTTMYSSLTVIPATTVYYEDEYVDLKTHTRVYTPATVADEAAFKAGTFYIYDETIKTYVKATAYDANASYFTAGSAYTPVDGWDVNSVAATQTQAVDRPGEDKMGGGYDSDNVYGYDPAYANSSTYSLGNAAKTQVVNGLNYATAQFEFYGTGFDVISLTSNKTGTIAVSVKGTTAVGGKVYSKNFVVDTYYGYVYENGEWVLTDSSDPNALYQIPVMKVSDLAYDKYTVTITASHAAIFDHEQYDGNRYDFYLDAIRVYDPCGKNDETANGAYGADGEFAPKYEELRNEIISADTFAGFFEVANIKTFDEKLTYFTKDEKGNFIEVAQDEEPVPGILYYTVEANEVNEFAEGTTYFTKVESEYYIQVAESKAYNAQKNYYIRAGYEQVEIDAFAEGITYYTKHEEVSYTQVLAEEAFDTEKTYYTAKYEQAEIDAFAEGVTYYAKDGDNSFAEVPTEEAFDAAKTYYIIKYEQAEIDAFAEGVTYYTKNVEISYTEVPAEEAFDAAKTYYTDKYEKIEIDAFEEDVIYYTKDIDYIVTASDALVEDVTYYTVKSQVEKISKFISGVNYFVKDASDRFSVLAPNESPAEDKLYYIMAEGIRINGIGFLNTTFIDGKGNIANIADYQNYGPNNEVYLAPDQAVAGNMFTTATINGYKACVYLGIKSVVGEASVKVYGVDTNGVETVAVNEKLSTATDMYYDISNLIGKTIVIHNSGSSGIVSITNVKTAYEKVKSPTNPANEESLTPNSVNAAAETEESMFTVDSETLKLALLSLSEPIKVEQPDAPEGGEPGGNEPGGEPEGGEPGGNEPGGEPEGGEPGGNEPGGEPEGGEPGGNEPSGEPEGGEPGGNEPGGEPEGGEPGGDAPQDPAPSEPVPEETEPEEKDSVEETIQDIVEIIRDIIGIIGGMFRGWF